jgi:hypothetical protein
MPLIADIFVTHLPGNREDLLLASLDSLWRCTEEGDYRLTLVVDGTPTPGLAFLLCEDLFSDRIHRLIVHRKTMGLGPSINGAVASISQTNAWFSDPLAGDPQHVAPFIVMCQDDVLYRPSWIRQLTKNFCLFEKSERLGFATGIECVEHPAKKRLPNGMLLKDWIRAAQMFGRREYWESMMPIPRFDPRTGQVRARPNDGIGSGVDWWLVADHPNSVCKTGRTNLVIPGLCQHAGSSRSTWLKRDLPESEADLATVARALPPRLP